MFWTPTRDAGQSRGLPSRWLCGASTSIMSSFRITSLGLGSQNRSSFLGLLPKQQFPGWARFAQHAGALILTVVIMIWAPDPRSRYRGVVSTQEDPAYSSNHRAQGGANCDQHDVCPSTHFRLQSPWPRMRRARMRGRPCSMDRNIWHAQRRSSRSCRSPSSSR